MRFPRSGGILCHPTSFPSRYGIGDLGKGAYDFVTGWPRPSRSSGRCCPWAPPATADSPYQSFSAFAGNPMLISPEQLVVVGTAACTTPWPMCPRFPAHQVDFGRGGPIQAELLRRSFEHFKAHATS